MANRAAAITADIAVAIAAVSMTVIDPGSTASTKTSTHYKHQYNKRRHYSQGSHNNYYYRDDDDDEKLLIGLVVGGILGYAINNAQHQDDISYDRYPAPSNAYPANNG